MVVDLAPLHGQMRRLKILLEDQGLQQVRRLRDRFVFGFELQPTEDVLILKLQHINRILDDRFTLAEVRLHRTVDHTLGAGPSREAVRREIDILGTILFIERSSHALIIVAHATTILHGNL